MGWRSEVRIHSYYTDNDYFYESSAMGAYASHLGLGSSTTVTTTVGGYAFDQQAWSGACGSSSLLAECQTRVVFEVHDANGGADFGATGNAFGTTSHNNFGSDAALWDGIFANALDQFIIDIGQLGGGGGGTTGGGNTGGGIDLWLEKIKEKQAAAKTEKISDKTPMSKVGTSPSLATYTRKASNSLKSKMRTETLSHREPFSKPFSEPFSEPRFKF